MPAILLPRIYDPQISVAREVNRARVWEACRFHLSRELDVMEKDAATSAGKPLPRQRALQKGRKVGKPRGQTSHWTPELDEILRTAWSCGGLCAARRAIRQQQPIELGGLSPLFIGELLVNFAIEEMESRGLPDEEGTETAIGRRETGGWRRAKSVRWTLTGYGLPTSCPPCITQEED